MSTGDNALTLRQFRYLQTRTLLHLQDELRVLERELFLLDERDARDRPHHLTSRETAAEEDGGREILMRRIRAKWTEYGVFPAISLRTSSGLEVGIGGRV